MNLALIPIFLVLGARSASWRAARHAGGFTIVPVLTRCSPRGFALEHVLPMASATSAATIIFTTFASTRAHHARGAVAGQSSSRWRRGWSSVR